MPEGFTSQTLHVHHSDELGIYEGDVNCRVVSNGQEYIVRAPAAVWNRAGAFHELTEVQGGTLHYYGIDYNSKLFDTLPKELVHTGFLQDYDLVILPLTEENLQELKPLAQIAYDYGFADETHLIRAFRKQYGETPGVFRRRYKNKSRSSH